MPDVNAPAPKSGGNVFARKMGPLPMWAWMAVGLLIAILIYMYNKNKNNNGSASQSTVNTPGGVDSSLVPQFVNQVYDESVPPAAPNVTVNNTVPDNDNEPPPTHNPHNVKPPARRPRGPAPKNPPLLARKYTVHKGETLDSIAAKFHVPRVDIAHANGIGTGAGLRTGQVIRVPGNTAQDRNALANPGEGGFG